MSKLYAAIHACRRHVTGLGDEDTWREFLSAVTTKRSLRALDDNELGRVLDALHARGAPTVPARAKATRLADSPQAKRARALWLDLFELAEIEDPSETALGAFVKRQTGRDALRFCAAEDMHKVIEALDAWCRRAGLDSSAKIVSQMGAGIKDAPDWKTRAFNALLMEAQWKKLIALGVFRHGTHARLDTWLNNQMKFWGCQHPVWLEAPKQRHAIKKLGEWLRGERAKRKAAASGGIARAERTT